MNGWKRTGDASSLDLRQRPSVTVSRAPVCLEASRRIALYSHDSQGLGHIRRNIALAAALVAADPRTDVLLLTGAPEATSLPLPPSTDIVTLPTIRKGVDGHYAARALSSPLTELLALRSSILAATLTAFAPDLLIVDKVARGVDGELDAALHALQETDTRVVLGLREILDSPSVTRHEWESAGTTEAVRELYDAVWVYGDREVYDLTLECALPDEVSAKVVYTGYLGNHRGTGTALGTSSAPDRQATDRYVPNGPYVLCLVGGGQDGLTLADAFVRAPLPRDHGGIVLTGPYMGAEALAALLRTASGRPGMTVLEFVPDAERFIAGAAAAVSMAGYNSVCELLAAGCRTLLVPRTEPRVEQAVRAFSLQRLGLVDVLEPGVAGPTEIGNWTTDAVLAGPPPSSRIDLDGLARVPILAEDLLAGRNGQIRELAHAV